MRKNQSGQVVAFQMISATDGSNVTAGTPTVYYTIDGGTQGTGSGTSTHEGNGQWSYAPTQAETNGDHVAFTMVLSGAISQTVNVYPSYLYASADTIVPGTVDTVTNGHTPTTTEFQADDITEATADHYNGRLVVFTSGALVNQFARIEDYVAVGGIGQFTVSAMTEAPANNDTFLIV